MNQNVDNNFNIDDMDLPVKEVHLYFAVVNGEQNSFRTFNLKMYNLIKWRVYLT